MIARFSEAQMVLHGVLEMEATGSSTYQKSRVNLGIVESILESESSMARRACVARAQAQLAAGKCGAEPLRPAHRRFSAAPRV